MQDGGELCLPLHVLVKGHTHTHTHTSLGSLEIPLGRSIWKRLNVVFLM